MLKALLKKQFAELGSAYAFNKKTGKKRSRGGVVGLVILLAFGALSCSAAFFGMGMLFASNFIPTGLGWLHFAIMGAIAVCVSLIGEVFATYSMLYNAKDNELLLALPIPSRTILLARMSTLYVMSLIFTAIVFVPAMLAYWINGGPFTALSIIFCVLLIFVLALLALALACLLGWVVALVASRIKGNKAVISVIVSVALLGLYYVVYFRMNKILNSAVENADKIAETMRAKLFPLYHMGQAATGNALYMLLFTAGVIALFAVVWLLLSHNFTRLALANRSGKKARLKSEDIRQGGVNSALLKREFKRFTSSAAYMLNCGLGIIMVVVLAVLALIKAPAIREAVAVILQNVPFLAPAVPVVITAVLMFIIGMNLITAPSVSLEGQNIWIVQTLPVDQAKVLRAKQHMHVILNGVTAIIAGGLLCAAFGLSVLASVFVVLCALAFVCFTAALGLAVNIKKPSLDWTNETVPIKQGAATVISLFSGWGVAAVFTAAGFFLAPVIGAEVYLGVMAAALLTAALLITRWINNNGAKIFAQL